MARTRRATLALALLLVAVAWAAAPALASTVRADTCLAKPCTACNQTRGGVSLLSSLPRYDFRWQRVPSNIAAFDWLQCDDEGTCEFADMGHDFQSTPVEGRWHSTPRTSPAAYVESIIMYAAVGVLLTVLSCCSCLCVCVGRSPLCRVCGGNGCCGGRYPTRAKGVSSCSCMGYHLRHSRTVRNLDGSAMLEPQYSRSQRWLPRVGFCLFLALFAGAVLVGELAGNRRLTGGMKAGAQAADGPVDLIAEGVPVAGRFLARVATDAIVPTLVTLRDAVAAVVDIGRVRTNLGCVSSTLHGLPRPVALLAYVAAVNQSIGEVRVTDAALTTQLHTLNTSIFAVLPRLDDTSAFVDSVSARITTTSTDVADVQRYLGDAKAAAASLLDATTGVVALRTNLTMVGDTNNYPTAAQIDAVTTDQSSPSTLAALLAGTMDGQRTSTARDDLLTKLDDVLATMAPLLPSRLGDTATGVEGIDAQVAALKSAGTLSSLHSSLLATNASLFALPGPVEVAAVADPLRAAVAAVDFTDIRASLAHLVDVLAGVPNPNTATADVDRFKAVIGALPCMSALVTDMQRVNESLVQVPNSVNDLRDMITTVNTSVTAALDQVEKFETFAVALADDLLHNAHTALGQVDTRVAQSDAILAALEYTLGNMTAAAKQMQALQQQVSLQAAVTSVAAAQQSLTSSALRVNATMVKDLRTLGTGVSAVAGLVRDTAASVTSWAEGRCSAGGTVAPGTRCTSSASPAPRQLWWTSAWFASGSDATPEPSSGDATLGDSSNAAVVADCGGTAQCLYAVRRCADDFTVACADGTNDACPGDSQCLFQAPLYRNTTGALQALAQELDEVPDVSSLTDALHALAAQLQQLEDLSVDGELSDVDTAIDAAQKQIAPAQAAITGAASDIDGLDVQQLLQQFKQVSSVLKDLPDLDAVDTQLRQLDSYLAEVEARQGQLANVTRLVDTLDVLLTHTIPSTVERLSTQAISHTLATSGAAGVLDLVARAAEAMLVEVTNATAAMSANLHSDTNLTALVQPAVRVLRDLSDPAILDQGGVYTMAKVLELPMAPASESQGGRVAVDANGDAYEDGHLCLTQACVDNSIDWANSATVTTMTDGSVPLPLNRLMMVLLLFAFPGIVALAGLVACIGSFFPGSWQRYPSCCATICGCILTPFLFLTVAAVLAPVAIVGADACASAGTMGVLVGQHDYHPLCQAVGGHNPPGVDTCTVVVRQAGERLMPEWPTPAVRGMAGTDGAGVDATAAGVADAGVGAITVTFNVSGVTTSVLTGDCTGALEDMFTQLGAAVGNALVAQFNASAAGATQPMDGFAVRPAVVDIVRRGVEAVADEVDGLATDLGGTWTCGRLNGEWLNLQETVCCHVMPPLFWLLLSWYVIALALCCCGSWSTLLGFKRFPSKVALAEDDAYNFMYAPLPAQRAVDDTDRRASTEITVVATGAGRRTVASAPSSERTPLLAASSAAAPPAQRPFSTGPAAPAATAFTASAHASGAGAAHQWGSGSGGAAAGSAVRPASATHAAPYTGNGAGAGAGASGAGAGAGAGVGAPQAYVPPSHSGAGWAQPPVVQAGGGAPLASAPRASAPPANAGDAGKYGFVDERSASKSELPPVDNGKDA